MDMRMPAVPAMRHLDGLDRACDLEPLPPVLVRPMVDHPPPGIRQDTKRVRQSVALVVRQGRGEEVRIVALADPAADAFGYLVTAPVPDFRRADRAKPDPPAGLDAGEERARFVALHDDRTAEDFAAALLAALDCRDLVEKIAEPFA